MIREARAADRDGIVALQLASWRDAYADVLPEAYFGAPLAADLTARWAARLFAPPELTLIMGDMEGFVCCLTDRAPPYIDNLHVRPGLRGRGTGAALMAALFERLRAGGHSACALTVLEANGRARAFYAGMGGVEGAARPTDLFGNPVIEVPVGFAL